jgi:hypothetical protein
VSFFDDEEGGPPRPAAVSGRGPTDAGEHSPSTETGRHSPSARIPRSASTPRPASRRTRTSPPRAGLGGVDHQTAVRRRIAAGVGVAVLIVVVLLINGCLKSGAEEALMDYNREAGQLVQESDQQVSAPLFKALAGASSESPLNVEVQVNQLRMQAQSQAARARALSVPGQMQAAQRNLTLTLDLREEALAKVAGLVRTALGGQGKQASTQIAGAMEMFLASDVVYSQRVAPLIQQALVAGGVHGQSTAGSQFLPNLGWLDPSTVQQRLIGHSAGSSTSGPVAPGTHGSALTGVSVGATTLEAPPALNHISGGSNPTFTVSVEDSGSNSETNVGVEVTVTAGGKQYKRVKTINKTEPGVTSKVDIPVEGVPLETAARVTVYVQAVPGETNLENNKGSYLAVFGK